MKWITGSDRLPPEFKLTVIARYRHTRTILYDFRDFVERQPHNLNLLEWLDETDPAPAAALPVQQLEFSREDIRKYLLEFMKYHSMKSDAHISRLIDDYLPSLPATVQQDSDAWISVVDSPLFTLDDKGNWECTDNGEGEFLAAVPYVSKNQPGKDLWWIKHCVIEDSIGMCVVGDDDNEPAGWDMKDVTHYKMLDLTPPSGK